jgi:hypothetical protein
MSEEKKTVYCGGGKKQSETWLKATINIDKIQEHIEEFKGTKFVRLNINVKDAPDQFGKDVSLSVDVWSPPEEFVSTNKENVETSIRKEAEENADDDDLPF